jgi:ABC-type multidrug transport system ATPase subunit
MDEAEALSTKMGIMVKGGVFKCMGSSQHIKNKYGTGYEIELKVKKLINDNDDLQKLMARYGLTSRVSIDISETQEIIKNSCAPRVAEILKGQIIGTGLGSDLYYETLEYGKGMINTENFVNWLYIEESGMSVIDELS